MSMFSTMFSPVALSTLLEKYDNYKAKGHLKRNIQQSLTVSVFCLAWRAFSYIHASNFSHTC